jgi:ABC-2 type transport system ATP-binding protein
VSGDLPGAVALEVKRLVKRYGSILAVDQVSFQVQKGQICGLLGPNGSGKSSLLHMITGVVKVTSGSIIIGGAEHSTVEAKRFFGFAPDDLALPGHLTGAEYLDLPRRLQRNWDPRIAAELIDILDLGADLGKLVVEYSHGMKRKIQIVAAVSHRPRLLILDEPYRGLDPAAALAVRTLVAAYTEQGGAVLLATHDLAAAETFCDKATILNEGQIVIDGYTHELMRHRGGSLEEIFLDVTGLKTRVNVVDRRLRALAWT